MNLDKVPQELKASSRWVLWRLETVEGRERCKVPKTTTGKNADPTDPASWCLLEEGLKHLPQPHPDYENDPCPVGVGLAIAVPYLAVDLDNCYDPTTGTIAPWALEMIQRLPRTYGELTPSGKGFHFWYRCSEHAKLPDGLRTKDAEVYSRKRYFTVTGNWVPSSAQVVTELDGNQAQTIFNLVEARRERKASPRTNPQEDLKLAEMMSRADFPDLSVAVQGLLTRLAIRFTGNRKMVEEEFLKSALYQQTHWKGKWARLKDHELDLACGHAHENIQRRIKNKPDPTTLRKKARVVEFERVEPRELEWLWPGVIPLSNVTLFAGIPGIGKSLLALDLVGRGSIGAQSVDKKAQLKPFKTLLLAAEDDRETILVPRLMAMKADLTKIRALDMVEFVDEMEEVQDSRMITLESDLNTVREIIRADPEYRLLVIDPISNYMGNKSMYKDQEFRSVVMPVVALAQETGIAVIIILHNSKQTGRTALEKIGVSLGGAGTARIGWSFFKTEDATEVLLMKKNLGKFPGLKFTTVEVPVVLGEKTTGQALIQYLGESDADADNLLASMEDPEERRNQQLLRFIHKVLPRGAEVAANLIFQEGQKLGFSQQALQKAKFQLGIGSRRKKEGWYWRWMDEAEGTPPVKDEAPDEQLF